MPKYPCTARAYKIWWDDGGNDLYVGSTVQATVATRMSHHRNSCRNNPSKQKYKIYVKMAQNIDFQYVCLGTRVVDSKDEQRMFEQEWIDGLKPNLNHKRAYTSPEMKKEWQKIYDCSPGRRIAQKKQREKPSRILWVKKWIEDNKEEISTKSKLYQEKNKEIIKIQRKGYWEENREKILKRNKEKITCECGKTISFASLSRHKKSEKHRKFSDLSR